MFLIITEIGTLTIVVTCTASVPVNTFMKLLYHISYVFEMSPSVFIIVFSIERLTLNAQDGPQKGLVEIHLRGARVIVTKKYY